MPRDNQQAVIEAILNKGRSGVTRTKQDKPYSRAGPSTTTPPNPDASWKHDLFTGPKELIGPPRSGRAKPPTRDLVDQIRDSPKDKMRGFGVESEKNLVSKGKGLMELLPASRPAASRGVTAPRRIVLPTVSAPISLPPKRRQAEQVPIGIKERMTLGVKGMADGPTKVVIEGLLSGTTSEDVKSAFSEHVLIQSVTILTSPSSSPTTSAELLLSTRSSALSMIEKFNDVVADGHPLKLYIPVVEQKLSERLGTGIARAGNDRNAIRLPPPLPPIQKNRPERRDHLLNDAMRRAVGSRGGSRGSELLDTPGTGKMYSDVILQNDASARVITLQDEEETRGNRRGGGGRNLSSRMQPV